MTAITEGRRRRAPGGGRKRMFSERHLFGVRLEEPEAILVTDAAAAAGLSKQEFLYGVVSEYLAKHYGTAQDHREQDVA